MLIRLACHLLILHICLKSKLRELKNLRERKSSVDFLVSKSVKIEHYALEVDNEHVWHFAKKLPLGYVDFLVAA